MRYKQVSNFIVTIIFSIVYSYIALLNILGPLHIQSLSIKGSEDHPFICILYWVISIAVIWLCYISLRNKPSGRSTFILFVVGIILVLVGVFLWDIAIHFENTIVPMR